MKNAISLILLLLTVNLWAANESGPLNYTGFGDTTQIHSFKADSLKYSGVFRLSAFENISFQVLVNDTSRAGFQGDSVNFFYFLERGLLTINKLGKPDTIWSPVPIIIDSVNMLVAGNFARSFSVVGTDGNYTEVLKELDTTSVTGYAVNERVITPAWAVLGRVGFKGLTGNKTGRFLDLRFGINRREYISVGAR